MSDSELFVDLEPPAGGLADLRARVASRRRPWILPVGMGVALALALLVVLVSQPRSSDSTLLAALELPEQSVWVGESASGRVQIVAETASVVLVRWEP